MKAYFISGLGADQRAFRRIQLPHGYEAVYLDWINPQPNEPLSHYAARLSKSITKDEEFILVGLSFGGMVASEIAKLRKPRKVIIISSLACCDELPWYFRKAGKFGLHRIVPIGLLKIGTLLRRIFGVGAPEDKAIVYEYVRDVNPFFLRWSLDAIIKWDHHERLPGLVHVHGRNDHLLPPKYLRPDYIIDKAGHLMVLNRPEEVNKILLKVLSN